ncbi:O-antigen polymerase [Fodinibius sediminis]|uniref:Uncharacterized protein n=1 Tax=Fodinibius sediminis TaxID=1214077 RepID=A0A521EUK3_9BACT|nr:O-antigen polymerase [Fodinibius sediminis]SMO87602.1 hypothetical protein SAMN06265218_11919 [Fodinibius sediminis]
MSSRILIYSYVFILVLIINETVLFGGGTVLDEVLLLFSFLLLVFYSVRDGIVFGKSRKAYIVILLFFAYSVFLFLWSPYSASFSYMFAQTAIVLKPFILMVIILRLFNPIDRKLISLSKIIKVQIYFVLFCVILNIIFRSSWNEILGVRENYRYGLLQLIGIFNGPGNLGDFLIMLVIVFIGSRDYRSNHEWLIANVKKILKFFSLALLLVLIFVGVRKPIFMTIPLIYYLYKYGIFRNQKKYVIQFGLAFVILGVIIGTNTNIIGLTTSNLSNFSNSESSYIRGLMFFHGVSLFITHFPFGVSAATFGSNLSVINTMSVYEATDLASTKYLSGEDAFGIFDSGFASFLAEFGFIGILIYCLFLKYFFKMLDDEYQVSLQVKMLTIYILIASIFSPGVFNGITSAIYCLFLVYRRNEEIPKWKNK